MAVQGRIRVMIRQLQRLDHKTCRNNWAFTGIFQPFLHRHKAHTQLNSPQLKFVSKFLEFPDFRGVHVDRFFDRLAFSAELLLEVCGSGIVCEEGLVHGCEAMAQGTGAGAQGVLREFIKARGQAT